MTQDCHKPNKYYLHNINSACLKSWSQLSAFILAENTFFSPKIHAKQFSLPLLFPASALPLPSRSTPYPFLFKKGQPKHVKTKYIKTMQKPSCLAWPKQPNWRKRVQKQAKESETHLLLLLRIPQKTHSNNKQRTCTEPLNPQVCCFSLWNSIWALHWFSGPCYLGVFHPF